jgi:hypothetical protein
MGLGAASDLLREPHEVTELHHGDMFDELLDPFRAFRPGVAQYLPITGWSRYRCGSEICDRRCSISHCWLTNPRSKGLRCLSVHTTHFAKMAMTPMATTNDPRLIDTSHLCARSPRFESTGSAARCMCETAHADVAHLLCYSARS